MHLADFCPERYKIKLILPSNKYPAIICIGALAGIIYRNYKVSFTVLNFSNNAFPLLIYPFYQILGKKIPQMVHEKSLIYLSTRYRRINNRKNGMPFNKGCII